MESFVEINRNAWNLRTNIHLTSSFYNQEEFLKGKNSLNSIELDLLGDVKGKKILHLQCHFGQDSISLARMGAKVIGIDLSDKAIETAKHTAQSLGVDAEFICCNIYDLLQFLDDQFDIVFTSYGVIGWLPDLDKWAGIVSRYLKPSGTFIFVEFHPLVWTFDTDFQKIAYNYFNVETIVETETGSYTDGDKTVTYETMSWNHNTGEVLNSLIGSGIEICSFNEYNYSPYNCFKHTVEFEEGKFRIEHIGDRMPMVFSLVGKKK